MRIPVKKEVFYACDNDIEFETTDKKFALVAFKYLRKKAEKKSEDVVKEMIKDLDDQIEDIEEGIREDRLNR